MRARVLLTVLIALAFPIGLAFAVYGVAGRSLAATPVVQPVTARAIAQPTAAPTTTERRDRGQTTTDDRSGKCDEAEHQNDPECASGGGGDDSGGSGNSGSSSDDSGHGSSNSGSGSSGSGGGDD